MTYPNDLTFHSIVCWHIDVDDTEPFRPDLTLEHYKQLKQNYQGKPVIFLPTNKSLKNFDEDELRDIIIQINEVLSKNG